MVLNIVETALVKLAQHGTISLEELKVLCALQKEKKDFLQLSEQTGLEMRELKEVLQKFEKQNTVKQENGKYSIEALKVLLGLLEEKEVAKQVA